MRVATLCDLNFLPHVRVLAESLAEHHPGLELDVLVADAADPPPVVPGCRILGPADLTTLAPGELERLAMENVPSTLLWALKAPLAAHLLAQTGDVVLYVDADTLVLDALDVVPGVLREAPVMLTRHLWRPVTTGTAQWVLLGGAHQAGVFAVAPGAEPFLDWWRSRQRFDASIDLAGGVFGDQRWLDLAPSLFDVVLSPEPGLNVNPVSLLGREVGRAGGRWTIDGAPLRLLHYGGGFDPSHPRGGGISARPTVRASRHPGLSALLRDTAERLRRHGAGPVTPDPAAWRWGRTPGGVPLDATMRRLYAEAARRARAGRGAVPPVPLLAAEEPAFWAWLAEPADRRREAVRLPRYLLGRAEEDAPAGDLLGGGAEGLLAWAAAHVDPAVPEALRTQAATPLAGAPEGPFELVPGVTVAGAPAEDGGRSAALVAAARAAGIPATPIGWASADLERLRIGREAAAGAVHDVNVLCLEPFALRLFDSDLGVTFRPWRYSVAVWDRAPDDETGRALPLVDEVWASSAALAAQLADWTSKPVIALAPPAVAAVPDPATVAAAGLGDAARPLIGTWIDLDRGAGPDELAALGRVLDAWATAEPAGTLVVCISSPQLQPQASLDAHVAAGGRGGVAVVEADDPEAALGLLAALDGHVAGGRRCQEPPGLAALALAGLPCAAPRGALGTAAVDGIAFPGEGGPGAGTAEEAALRALLAAGPGEAARRSGEAAEAVATQRSLAAVGERMAARLAELTEQGDLPVGPRGERPPA